MVAGLHAIYEELSKVAQSGNTTYYSDIAPLAGLDMSSEGDRFRIAQILGEISEDEHRDGRPLLSAVVILKGENRPGEGFFGLGKTWVCMTEAMPTSIGRKNLDVSTSFWSQNVSSKPRPS